MKTVLLALLLTLAIAPVADAGPGKCVTTLDDMISDGGSTYCVLTNGCVVWESREYIWGREYYCYP